MIQLTQNKKIAISAVALFLISFAIMLIFLGSNGVNSDAGFTNVLGAGESETQSETKAETKTEVPYFKYIEDLKAPFFVANMSGDVVYASKNLLTLLSVKDSEFIGYSFYDFINIKDVSDAASLFTKLVQDKEKSNGIGPFRMIKGNSEILVLFDAVPIMGEHGKITEILFSIKDLTSKVRDLKNSDDPDQRIWLEEVYPKIKEMRDQTKIKMMVDKMS